MNCWVEFREAFPPPMSNMYMYNHPPPPFCALPMSLVWMMDHYARERAPDDVEATLASSSSLSVSSSSLQNGKRCRLLPPRRPDPAPSS